MSFVDMVITRRQFAARYANVGRAMLGQLADIYGVDIDLAEHWADEIDRECECAARLPQAPLGGANLAGAACIAAPVLSSPLAVGSHDGARAASSVATARDNFTN